MDGWMDEVELDRLTNSDPVALKIMHQYPSSIGHSAFGSIRSELCFLTSGYRAFRLAINLPVYILLRILNGENAQMEMRGILEAPRSLAV